MLKVMSCPVVAPVMVLDVTFPLNVMVKYPYLLASNAGVELNVTALSADARLVNEPEDGTVEPIAELSMLDSVMTALEMDVPESVPPVIVGLVIVAPLMVPFRNASPGT